MQRLKRSYPDLEESWGIIDKTTASEFIKTSQHLFGLDLKKEMQNLIADTVTNTMDWEFKSGGGFYDKSYFDKVYQGREDQKQSILENSKKHECKVRRVTLYQDPTYEEHNTERLQQIEERKREIIQEQMIKAKKQLNAKNAKTKRKAMQDANCVNMPHAKPLTKAEEKRLQAMSDKFDEAINSLNGVMEEANENSIKENIPMRTTNKCLDAAAMAQQKHCAIQLALSSKICVDVKEDLAAGKKTLERLITLSKQLREIVDSVKSWL